MNKTTQIELGQTVLNTKPKEKRKKKRSEETKQKISDTRWNKKHPEHRKKEKL